MNFANEYFLANMYWIFCILIYQEERTPKVNVGSPIKEGGGDDIQYREKGNNEEASI